MVEYLALFFSDRALPASSGGDKVIVALPAAFCREEVVIGATHVVRVFPADLRPRFIDGAAAFALVKELAYAFEYVVFSVTQNAVTPGDFGIFFFGVFVGQLEVFRQSQQILFGHFDAVIAATIAGTFRAVEEYPQRSRGFLIIGYFHQFFPERLWLKCIGLSNACSPAGR
jgi:hypothetical protein